MQPARLGEARAQRLARAEQVALADHLIDAKPAAGARPAAPRSEPSMPVSDVDADSSRSPLLGLRARLWMLCICTGLIGLVAIGLGLRQAEAQHHHQHLLARLALQTQVAGAGAFDAAALGAWQGEFAALSNLLQSDPLAADGTALHATVRQWHAASAAFAAEWSDDLGSDRATPSALHEATATLANASTRLLIASWADAAAQDRDAAHRRQALALAAFVLVLLVAALSIEPVVAALRRERSALQRDIQDHERLARVAQHTSNSVAFTDADGRLTWVNDGFTRLWGYTAGESLGRPLAQLIAGDLTDREALSALHDARARGSNFRRELLCRAKDGVDHWVDLDLQPMHDAQGHYTGSISVATEITGHVRARQQLDAILGSVPTGVLVFDHDGAVIGCNPAASHLLERPVDEMMGSQLVDVQSCFVDEDLRPLGLDAMPAARALAYGESLRGVSLGMVTPGGELRWMLGNAEPLRDASGRVERVIASFVDVSALRRQERVLAATVDGAGLGVWEADLRSGTTTCNDRLVRLLGYAVGELDIRAGGLESLMHPEDRDRWRWTVGEHLKDASQPCRMDVRLRRPDGDWAWATATGAVVERAASGQPVRLAGVIIDMTEHMQMQAMLMHTARTDSLTQLPNRAQLMERLDTAVRAWQRESHRRFALLYMDFDRFKLVNDTHGHAVGDALLRQIAERLQGSLRRGDMKLHRGTSVSALPARISGDEFVVLLEGIDGLATAQVISERLLAALADPYTLGPGVRVHSSASIGIVSSEHCGADADVHSLLRDADTAMYEAKRAGRARAVVFDRSMHQVLARRSELEAELRVAIAQGQIVPAYQPIMDLAGGRVAGVEALARWQHPERGAVSPAEFIPVAEDCGLIGALGAAMLEIACRDFVVWQRTLGDSAPPTVSVNLSRAQLASAGLVEEVRRVLEDTGIEPHRLQLEVTESLAGEESSVRESLGKLKALGLTLALDDFGTGYSSLACLGQMPVDSVKIDRAFVRDAQTNPVHRVLIQATVQVAHALGMTTVAEGVETDGQAEMVRTLGCSKAQGFLFSRPLLARDLVDWLGARALILDPSPAEVTAR
jgi:diguanylate cyclase (GGDEF)-like protein/PAS domain S-box-containing protein